MKFYLLKPILFFKSKYQTSEGALQI